MVSVPRASFDIAMGEPSQVLVIADEVTFYTAANRSYRISAPPVVDENDAVATGMALLIARSRMAMVLDAAYTSCQTVVDQRCNAN